MKPVTVVATLKAKPGHESILLKAATALIAPTRLEAGCINYDLHRSLDHPEQLMFYENWKSQADLDAHLRKPHLQAFLAQAGDWVAEPPRIALWEKL